MLNATRMNLINALVLIAMGLWGFLELNSPTALIPVGFGVVLLLCYQGVKNQNKIIAHVAVLLTLLILVALVGMRLPKSISQGGLGLYRVVIMVVTSALSMVYFIKSFKEARKNREEANS
jgi:Ca2+/Na+ antiporter